MLLDNDGLDGAHGWYGVGQRNLEGRMLLDNDGLDDVHGWKGVGQRSLEGSMLLDNDGLDGVHGWDGVGQRSLEGRMLLELCLKNELCVSITWFKREEKWKVTFTLTEHETEIDFMLTKKGTREVLVTCKALPG